MGMEIEFLKALVVILGVSALSIFLLHRLKMPPLIGFIAAGVIIGPYGLGIITDMHEIEVLAEIGIILLLFTVGIEFSMSELMRFKRVVVLGGGLQVGVTIMAAAALAYPFTKDLNISAFIGFLAALSSTAIVLKMLIERGEMDSPQGRTMTGILIFQDLCVVPLMLLTHSLSGETTGIAAIGAIMLKGLAIIFLVLLSARWIVPGLLHQIVKTRSSELFTVTIMLVCLGIALLTARFGLSLALGAFLAGLVISDSEYAYEATAKILPFKEGFLGLFFVSVGMLINTGFMAANYSVIILTVLAVFVLKTLITAAVLLVVPTSPRVSMHAALGLAQVGEFSFVLAAVGKSTGLISGDLYQMFLSAAVITMVMTPFILKLSPGASAWLASQKAFARLGRDQHDYPARGKLAGHAIIIGFGLNGRNLARTLRGAAIPYVVLELNSDTVMAEKKKGHPIYYGDGTSREMLQKLGVRRARLLVVAISDPSATRKIVAITKYESPSTYVIVRTRYLKEVEALNTLGADEVIPEEFETSVEIFSRVLHLYNVPRNVINDYIDEARKDSYRVFRAIEPPSRAFSEHIPALTELETETYLAKEGSFLIGRSLRELNLRAQTGATAMAVHRGDTMHQNPPPDFTFAEGDVVLLVGKREDLNRAFEFIEQGGKSPE
jgi:CPA2 family monovalent cation:H+ antiporter-2